ncbi:Autophagy- protein 18d [Dionaea muscipula]
MNYSAYPWMTVRVVFLLVVVREKVRRGTEKADVCGIAFSPNAQWLAVSSDKGTIHIFSLRVRVGGEDASIRPVSSQTTVLAHRTSSNSLEPLISSDAGANPSLSLPFMKGTTRFFQGIILKQRWYKHNQ